MINSRFDGCLKGGLTEVRAGMLASRHDAVSAGIPDNRRVATLQRCGRQFPSKVRAGGMVIAALKWEKSMSARRFRAGRNSSVLFHVSVCMTCVALFAVSAAALDCNGNGIEDTVDINEGTSQDCNGNGVPDECDIASGTSMDCNENGVPDVCDVAFGSSVDCNGNEVPDECDIDLGLASDCNGNGIPDVCDVQSGFSEDLNGNEFPDECDPDCNSNGVPDDIDLSTGASEDCNTNGLPDECDILFGLDNDCNNNGIPDLCDAIAGNGGPDCNMNGLFDQCDIDDGTSEDCDLNGVPDECDPDCNANGIPDACDIAAGTLLDCNGNLIPDSCEIDLGLTPDCNENGIPDSCDLASGVAEDCDENGQLDVCQVALVNLSSPTLAPIGSGESKSVDFSDLAEAGGSVLFTFEAIGDFGAPVETIDVHMNEILIGTIFEVGGQDCSAEPIVGHIVLSAADFNNFLDVPPSQRGAAAVTSFELDPSDAVDPDPVLCDSSITMSIEYQAITGADANGNGIPDVCEDDLCDGDVDGDNIVGLGDLLGVLSGWGACDPPCPPGCGADLDGDCNVGLGDLLEVLSNWGTDCP